MSDQNSISAHLHSLGINEVAEIIYNPDYERLFSDETAPHTNVREDAIVTITGAVAVDTGIFTGRSPADKYFVRDDVTKDALWWNDNAKNKSDNKAITQEIWEKLKTLTLGQLTGKALYVVDAWCGASPGSRLAVRFITEVAWQAHFVTNMFIRPSEQVLVSFVPDFVVLNSSKVTNPDWQSQGLNSENFVAFNLSENIQLIGGTWYGGEMKKGLFSIMNFLLPRQGIASMHCSANVGKQGDVALFFGLSGTGKTTLSTNPDRLLIGDDEHGWDNEGIFNFEGGCYAKTINLRADKEPEIFQAIRRDALLENVMVRDDGTVDYDDVRKTENTRVSYPLGHIVNSLLPPSRAGHASKIIFLTADAFGVLPPVSRLTETQMQYHFLSGFTAKLAGTERGITEPTPTFSACFGAAFLSLHPTCYADILLQRVRKAGGEAWLINTGWNGKNQRISLSDTRRIVNAVLNNELSDAEMTTLPVFDLAIPLQINGIDKDVLDPRYSWESEDNWLKKANTLAEKFIRNFDRFSDTETGRKLNAAGPRVS
mgnify:CR=1 FL=1